MDIHGYPQHRLIGVHGGRGWHLRSGGYVKLGGFLQHGTLCGKPGDTEWRPGINNRNAPVCGACRRQEARSSREAG